MTAALAFASVFFACAVELVEAATIVLAVGFTRGWRPALAAAGVATTLAAAAIAVLGPALERVPLDDLRLLVGILLLVFGLQWLRKAVLRASGRKAKRDEDASYAREAQEARTGGRSAFALVFQGVLIEELEVAVIVLTLGAAHGSVALAASAAAAAFVIVSVAAAVARHPLSRVPENALSLAVGVMLTSFGLFWTVEGVRIKWPGGDAMLPLLVAAVAATAWATVYTIRRAPT